MFACRTIHSEPLNPDYILFDAPNVTSRTVQSGLVKMRDLGEWD